MARPAKPRTPSPKNTAKTKNNASGNPPSIAQEEMPIMSKSPSDATSETKAVAKAAPKTAAKAKPASPKKAVAKTAQAISAEAVAAKAAPKQEEPQASSTPVASLPNSKAAQTSNKHAESPRDKPAPKLASKPNTPPPAQKPLEQQAPKAVSAPKTAPKQDIKPEKPAQEKTPPPPQKPANEAPLPLAEFLVQKHGLRNTANVFANLGTAQLYEHILFLREGTISAQGAVVLASGGSATGAQTASTSGSISIVEEPVNQEYIAWNNAHRPFDQAKFNALKTRIAAYLQGKNIYVQDCFVGSDIRFRLPFRIITEHAAQSLAARNLFVEAQAHELKGFDPRMTILSVPNFKAVPELDGTPSEAFAVIDFSQRLALICGAKHIGDIKNIAFTVMSYAMPLRKVLPLHAATLLSSNADTTLLLGAPGTGKTTLAPDAVRQTIGDDAHAWGDEGVFNLESGIFTRVPSIIQSTAPNAAPHQVPPHHASDPQTLLAASARGFGTVLENAQLDPTQRTVTHSGTSAMFAAIPRTALGVEIALSPKNRGGHPKHVIILVNDAQGVLPPVARLTHEQAVFFFLTGYTSRAPEGTEKEPQTLFNPCFAEVQMLEDPLVYANLFREKLRRNRVNTWLVNTGNQGEFGKGARIKQEHSRAIIHAIVNGALQNVEYSVDALLGLQLPATCQGLPSAMLNPRMAWADRTKFDKTAQNLIKLFNEQFTRFADKLDPVIADSLNPATQQALLEQLRQQNQPQSKPEAKPDGKPNGKTDGKSEGKPAPQQAQKGNFGKSEPTGRVANNKNAPPTGDEVSDLQAFEDISDDISDDASDALPTGLFARTDAPEFAPEFHPTLESAIDAAFEGDDDVEGMDNTRPADDEAPRNPERSAQEQRTWRGSGGNRYRGGRGGGRRR